MEIILHRKFLKQYGKLQKAEREMFKKRKEIFLLNPFDPILNNHLLSGEYSGYRSINITGDVRVIYWSVSETVALFEAIGTHSQLYE